MNPEDLSRLSLNALYKVKRKNHTLFHVLTLVNILSTYHSLITENAAWLFINLGGFVACMGLYHNYRIVRDMIRDRQTAGQRVIR